MRLWSQCTSHSTSRYLASQSTSWEVILKREDYWSKFARNYDKGVDHIVGEAIQQEIKKRLSEERNLGDILEFGCGTGYFTKVVAQNAERVLATDLSDEMLELARTQLNEFENG